jgi:protein-S-isoprenylcysteine O-methyltransferase Ste14
MEKLIKNILGIVLLFVSAMAHAQTDVEMADGMRSEGKIYVVVGIILIVLVGLVIYLFMLDRKVKKLENLLGDKNLPGK